MEGFPVFRGKDDVIKQAGVSRRPWLGFAGSPPGSGRIDLLTGGVARSSLNHRLQAFIPLGWGANSNREPSRGNDSTKFTKLGLFIFHRFRHWTSAPIFSSSVWGALAVCLRLAEDQAEGVDSEAGGAEGFGEGGELLAGGFDFGGGGRGPLISLRSWRRSISSWSPAGHGFAGGCDERLQSFRRQWIGPSRASREGASFFTAPRSRRRKTSPLSRTRPRQTSAESSVTSLAA